MASQARFGAAALCLIACVIMARAQSSNGASPKAQPQLSAPDRIRLAEAFRIGEKLGDKIWKGWSRAPFAVLLVTPEYEFLIRHPKPSEDFTRAGYDGLLKSDLYFRKRVFQPNLLATFPAVNGISTIVVGQAANTDARTSTPWVVTLLHEHFHQLQDSEPGFYSEVNALNLSRGDQTGMWMLNYAFPYEKEEIVRQFYVLGRALAEALQPAPAEQFATRLRAYLEARSRFKAMLAADDYNYFSFQLWKEGVARYTEYRIARLAAAGYKPGREFRALKDFNTFSQTADSILTRINSELSVPSLERQRRVAFYAVGAAEALLLDRANPGWQRDYFREKFFLERFFRP
ncbi:MAG TPA: hypothetical protein VF735_06510 [Pyrinomonadaceae bacterium]|jgi:hypothetical protein